jgi:hypothetical protein
MDFAKGKEYCAALCAGADENALAAKEALSIQELYGVVGFEDITVARTYLKHYCGGIANSLCFCWPFYDEKWCPVNGYEPDCPLRKD